MQNNINIVSPNITKNMYIDVTDTYIPTLIFNNNTSYSYQTNNNCKFVIYTNNVPFNEDNFITTTNNKNVSANEFDKLMWLEYKLDNNSTIFRLTLQNLNVGQYILKFLYISQPKLRMDINITSNGNIEEIKNDNKYTFKENILQSFKTVSTPSSKMIIYKNNLFINSTVINTDNMNKCFFGSNTNHHYFIDNNNFCINVSDKIALTEFLELVKKNRLVSLYQYEIVFNVTNVTDIINIEMNCLINPNDFTYKKCSIEYLCALMSNFKLYYKPKS